jgi:hypothetical protein
VHRFAHATDLQDLADPPRRRTILTIRSKRSIVIKMQE